MNEAQEKIWATEKKFFAKVRANLRLANVPFKADRLTPITSAKTFTSPLEVAHPDRGGRKVTPNPDSKIAIKYLDWGFQVADAAVAAGGRAYTEINQCVGGYGGRGRVRVEIIK